MLQKLGHRRLAEACLCSNLQRTVPVAPHHYGLQDLEAVSVVLEERPVSNRLLSVARPVTTSPHPWIAGEDGHLPMAMRGYRFQ